MNERDFPQLVELEWPEPAHKLPPKKSPLSLNRSGSYLCV